MPPRPDLSRFALVTDNTGAVPLMLVGSKDASKWCRAQTPAAQKVLARADFTGATGQVVHLPGRAGELAQVVVGFGEELDMWALGGLPTTLPVGSYQLINRMPAKQMQSLLLGWALGAYRFDRYISKKGRALAQLVLPPRCDVRALHRAAEATWLVRDLINLPANELGPDELAQVGAQLAERYGGSAKIIRGEGLLEENYPAIYEVGKGSARPPLLLDLRWGPARAPKVTLVGKGVVFDTGGYDLKPASGMLDMKKDMGGAALALGLALMIMDAELNINLRVLIPAVENSVSGHAFRPRDIIPSRSGKTIEIGNTDAEGRLVLSDCLYEASRENPAMLLDFATLTGARNVALGPEIAALFCNNEPLAAALAEAAEAEADPLWRLPLWKPYWRLMNSKVADMNNAGSSPHAGAITAALFLQQFIGPKQTWAHFDFNAYNTSARPGRPEGGEAMGLRACYAVVAKLASKARA